MSTETTRAVLDHHMKALNDGDIVWRVANIPIGTDTFVVRDGKIVPQTVTTYTGA